MAFRMIITIVDKNGMPASDPTSSWEFLTKR